MYAELVHRTTRAELPAGLIERLAEFRRCEPVPCGELRSSIEQLTRQQHARLRGLLLKQLAVTQLRTVRHHPAIAGVATTEKVMALISGEALRLSEPIASAQIDHARWLYLRYGAELFGDRRAADPWDCDLWIDRLARSEEARALVERGGGAGFAVIAHIGICSLDALASRRRELLALAMHEAGYLDRLRDYLDAFGVAVTLGALEKIGDALLRPGARVGHLIPGADLALH